LSSLSCAVSRAEPGGPSLWHPGPKGTGHVQGNTTLWLKRGITPAFGEDDIRIKMDGTGRRQ